MTAMRSSVNWIHVLNVKDAGSGEKDTKIIALRSGDGTYLLFIQTSCAGIVDAKPEKKRCGSAATYKRTIAQLTRKLAENDPLGGTEVVMRCPRA